MTNKELLAKAKQELLSALSRNVECSEYENQVVPTIETVFKELSDFKVTPSKLDAPQFRALLDLFMVSDPAPLEVGYEHILGLLNQEAAARGFKDWVDAYHFIVMGTVPCKHCGDQTPMLGTKTCDRCWELETRIRRDPKLAEKILDTVKAEKR